MIRYTSSAVLIWLVCLCAAGLSQQAPGAIPKPRITLDEFFNFVRYSDIKLSPDGSSVVIATERPDWKLERFRQDLWLWTERRGALVPLTQSGHDSAPQWSPDGNWIAFLSDRKLEEPLVRKRRMFPSNRRRKIHRADGKVMRKQKRSQSRTFT